MTALGEELPQAFQCKRDGIRARHADGVEALRARGIGKRALERGGIVQKSRSA
jgi:hypothetical protein